MMLRKQTQLKKSKSVPNIILEKTKSTNMWQKKHKEMYRVADDKTIESKKSSLESEDEYGGGIPEEILDKVHNMLSKRSGGVTFTT